MTGRTHDMAAFTALLALVILYPPEHITLATALVALLANMIGGIAPDIDQPTAPFWRNLPVGGVVGRMITRMMGGHRFITHSFVGVVLLAFLSKLLLTFLSPLMHGIDTHMVWLAFLIGVASHLVMDMFTKEGVPLLLPISIKFGLPPIRALRVTTGKAVELYLIFPGLAFVAIALVSTYYHSFVELIHQHITQ
jgi:inner membrane protein